MACDPRTSQALIEALFTSSSMGLALFDPDGRVRSSEGAASHWAPAVGESIFDSNIFVGAEEAIAALRGTTESLLYSGVSMGADDGRAIDLRVLWVEALICFAAFSTTATERNLMQAQVFQIVRDNRLLQQQVMDQQAKIVEQAGMMDLFIRHVPAAVAMLDDRLEPMMLSQRWIREFGDPATGEETGAARSPLHVPEIEAALGLALDTGVTSSRVTRLSERGALVWKRWEQTPWRRADRSVGGAILFIEDITDAMRQTLRLRTQTQQVQRLDEEMRTLANALADDLSGPLAQLEEVARGAAADEAIAITDARRDRLRRTRASVDKLKSMLTALRRYIATTSQDFVLTPFDVGDAIDLAAARREKVIRTSGARIVLHPTLSVVGDIDLMSYVFELLIENALVHAGGAPTITVDCEELDGEIVTVRLTDDGPGIAPHLHGRALAPFGRVTPGDSSVRDGMGLAMARKIVELHGGTLALDPRYELGLRVVINLPRRPAPAEAAR